ncbi:hypothetical protein Q4595_16340 [Wenyingzhuangia sp. 1_MG-2023]|nr:hypothetical protein [Wenyingzhuangia sp. 1_MG-2023]
MKSIEFETYLNSIVFDDLRKYQNLIENFLVTQKINLEEKNFEVEINNKMNDSEKYDKYLELVGSENEEKFENYHEIARMFPHNFRVSFLTQIISVVETKLNKICDDLGTIKNQKFMVGDLKGSNDFEKCKEYLKKISDIDFNTINNEWEYVLQCKSLRNNLVHSGNSIKMNNKKLVNFIENNESFECDYVEYIDEKENIISFVIINSKLIDKLIDKSQNLFEKLLKLKIQ